MKKLILFLTFVFILPAWALCPVGDGESVCTLPNQNQGVSLFQEQRVEGLTMNDSSMPSNALKTRNKGSSFNRTLNQNGIRMQGNIGCQFGNCNRENSNDFLMNK